MKTAIKLISEDLSSCLRIAENYNKEARFELSEGDTERADTLKRLSDSFLKKANECEIALAELNSVAV